MLAVTGFPMFVDAVVGSGSAARSGVDGLRRAGAFPEG
jgi:hypothetical protein